MKVFWSWQSDTAGKVGRHFVRDALKGAIEKLKAEPEVDEPTDREAREALHLDQDRQNVPGSPDLARTILDKIEKSQVFVADVTPVAETIGGKKIMNPNVAIELGYAMKALGDTKILMVLNESFGSRDDLPFDLKHKAGPIFFNLPKNADKKRIKNEREALKVSLVHALKPYIEIKDTDREKVKFIETDTTTCKSIYFQEGEALAAGFGDPEIEEIKDFTYHVFRTGYFHLRLIPSKPLKKRLTFTQMKNLDHNRLIPLGGGLGAFRARNRHGYVVFSNKIKTEYINKSTQVFESGEIWGVNSSLLKEKNGRKGFSVQTVEKAFIDTLPNYLEYAEKLELEFPYVLEFGCVGIENAYLSMFPYSASSMEGRYWGPIYKQEHICRTELHDGSMKTWQQLLLIFFEELFEDAGKQRPENLYGFPSFS